MELKAGDKFNWLTLVEKVDGGRSRWLCRCDCGKEEIKRKDWIISGRTKSCKSCASKRTAAKYGMPNNSEAIGDLGRTFYSTIKNGAERRGYSFNLSQKFLWGLLVDQGFKCKLTGVTINLSTKIKNNSPDYSKFNASLDRIDSTKGYTEFNVQWVHKDINRLKNNYTQEKFIEMCTLVYNHANQQPSLERDLLEGSTTNRRD